MIIKTTHKNFLVAILAIFTVAGCAIDDELIEELQIEREFAPIGLKSMIRNQTAVELTWTADEYVENYAVEISESEDFSTLAETANVTASQLPVLITLSGETLYYIRVKAKSSRGLQDSKWAQTTAQTLTEQLFLPSEPGDIQATEAILRWSPNNTVTEIVITPGDITHVITPQEIADGIATITGLTGETEYTATLWNNTTVRGISSFTTGIDIGDGILVTPEDDLFQMIANASPGDVLVLDAGDYTEQIGTISLTKSITIRGLRSYDKPRLKVSFSVKTGAVDVSLIDLDLTGDTPSELIDVIRYSEPGDYNSLIITGCNIHDYNRSFIAGNTTSATINSITVDNNIVTNILSNGGDFIDFRNTNVFDVAVTNSTFANCAADRDFFRIDAAGDANGTGRTVNVLLDSCTLYGVSDANKRILYVRFNENIITVRNTLFADTGAYYSNQTSTDPNTTFLNNNYFNAPGFTDSTQRLFDESGTDFSLDPGFANAAANNFTISNQTLIDNNIGDPRWRP